jgi:hypothetical protein
MAAADRGETFFAEKVLAKLVLHRGRLGGADSHHQARLH